jgi:hypothetical protein
MKKAEDYRQHARECRQMANRSCSPEQKQMLRKMADIWDFLAVDREAQVARQERLLALEKSRDATPVGSIPIGSLNAANDE